MQIEEVGHEVDGQDKPKEQREVSAFFEIVGTQHLLFQRILYFGDRELHLLDKSIKEHIYFKVLVLGALRKNIVFFGTSRLGKSVEKRPLCVLDSEDVELGAGSKRPAGHLAIEGPQVR